MFIPSPIHSSLNSRKYNQKYRFIQNHSLYHNSYACVFSYGFVTFQTIEEAKRVLMESDNLVLKDRKLNVAIAVKKQPVGRVFGMLHKSFNHKIHDRFICFHSDTNPYMNGTILYHGGIPPYQAYLNEAAAAAAAHYYPPELIYPYGTPANGMTGATPTAQPPTPTYPILYQHPIYVAQPQAMAMSASACPPTHLQSPTTATTTNWAIAAPNGGQWQWPPSVSGTSWPSVM